MTLSLYKAITVTVTPAFAAYKEMYSLFLLHVP